jgi:hypothetical protein
VNFLQLQDSVLGTRFNTGQRPEAKNWINARYQQVWGACDWPWKRREGNLGVTGGQQTVNLATNLPTLNRIISLHTDEGDVIPYLAPGEWDKFYAAQTDQGTPEAFTLVNNVVYLGPIPSTSANYPIRYEAKITLLDDDSDEPLIPEADHYILVVGAMSLGLKWENDPTWDLPETEYQTMLMAMKNNYMRVHMGENESYGGPDQWWGP